MAAYESEVTVVSSKGQVVIPRTVRSKLRIKPKTKLLVYAYDDSIVMKELKIPDFIKTLESIHGKTNKRMAKYGKITDKEINEIVQKYRHGQK
ncbi:MAG: AbrB/MazE/SpoVT family DNA-binding domain-containing protein [Candidatus Micrarchaeota archaeon]|nr:AbrB/MazE/SpoVT family DNA-binding domain-containing protein [Candidatus Micrarchaeota archaeon]